MGPSLQKVGSTPKSVGTSHSLGEDLAAALTLSQPQNSLKGPPQCPEGDMIASLMRAIYTAVTEVVTSTQPGEAMPASHCHQLPAGQPSALRIGDISGPDRSRGTGLGSRTRPITGR